MHFTPSILLFASLAGQIAIAVPVLPRAVVIQTEIRTIYSTKVVSATPSTASTNPVDGLPIAPSISKLSIPLSSIVGVNPINGLPVPTVKKTTSLKPVSTKAPAANASAAAGLASMIAQLPKASSSKAAAAGIASAVAQVPKQSSTKAAAAGVASILAHLPKHSSTTAAAGIVIVPVTQTVKTTQKPKAATVTKPAMLQSSSSKSQYPYPSKDAKAEALLAQLSAAQN